MRDDGPEHRIASLAAAQHGVVTRGQLLSAGLSPAAIGRRARAGRLRTLHRGIYLVGPLELPRTRMMAAALFAGPAALVSHTSGLTLWGMLPGDIAGPVHVTVPGTGRRHLPGIRFHRARRLEDDERGCVDGIPVTAPGRTLVDAAGMLGLREIEQVVALAEREGLIQSETLAALPARYPNRPGMDALRAVIGDPNGPAFVRSEAERRCLDLIAHGALPRPQTNVTVGPYELDLFWPNENVAVEIDGRAHHASGRRFEADRRKDNWLRARGIEVVRLSWRQITRRPCPTAVELGQILALARERRAR